MAILLTLSIFCYCLFSHCFGQTRDPPSSGLYFMLNEAIYLPGDSVLINDIGLQDEHDRTNYGSTLRCITNNVNLNCCRSSDNLGAGPLGEWYYPDGRIVPTGRDGNASIDTFARYVYIHEIRLGSLTGTSTEPVGLYRCGIPDVNGDIVNASISLVSSLSVTTPSEETHIPTTPMPTTVTDAVTFPIPEVTITPSSITASYFSELVLNCTSNVVGIFAWSLLSGNILMSLSGITIMNDTRGSYSVLNINSVEISHADRYMCEVTSNELTGASTATVMVKLAAPAQVNINTPPPYPLTGSSLSLSCVAALSTPLFSDTNIEIMWTLPDNSIFKGLSPPGIELNFATTLTLSSLTTSNAGNYSCSAKVVTSLQYVVSSSIITNSTNLILQVAAPELVMLNTPPSSLSINSSFSLSCLVTLATSLVPGTAIEILWILPDNSTVMGQNYSETNLNTTLTSNGRNFNSTLNILSLNTSDAGSYTCKARVKTTLSYVISSNSTKETTDLTLQVQAPSIIVLFSSPDTTIYEGMPFTLTCIIQLMEAFSDDYLALQANWMNPNGSLLNNMLSGFDVRYHSTAFVDSANMFYTSGNYTCSTRITSSKSFILSSEVITKSIFISILPLPMVQAKIQGFPTDSNFFTGLQLNLTSFITISQVFVSPNTSIVTALWSKSGLLLQSNSQLTVMEPYMNLPFMYLTSLMFNSLDPRRDEGEYQCKIQVLIPGIGTDTYSWNTTLLRTLIIPTISFQIRISGNIICEEWKRVNQQSKSDDIVAKIMEVELESCNCDFTADRIRKGVFLCSPSYPQSVFYQAELHGTLQANTSHLITILKEWILLSNNPVSILVHFDLLTVDDFCTVSSNSVQPCVQQSTTDSTNTLGNTNIVANVAGTVVGVVVVATGIVVVVTIVLYHCLRKRKYSLKKEPDVVISNTEINSYSPTNIDNEYYEEIEDFRTSNFITKCEDSMIVGMKNPAYVPSSSTEDQRNSLFTTSGYVDVQIKPRQKSS